MIIIVLDGGRMPETSAAMTSETHGAHGSDDVIIIYMIKSGCIDIENTWNM
jgi:hypothetical protein